MVLTGIHLSSYGVDLEGEDLLSLILAVHEVEGIQRIRLGSLEPRIITEEFAKNNLYDFVQYLKKNKKWENQIEEIIVGEDEDIELVPRIGKQLILFGKMSNFEEKFKAIDLLYSEVFSKTGWNYYNKIDLRYEGKIICTKNKQ